MDLELIDDFSFLVKLGCGDKKYHLTPLCFLDYFKLVNITSW